MKKLFINIVATMLSFTAVNAAIIELDGTNGIVTSTITAGSGTTYSVIDAAGGTVTLSATDEYILKNITFVENGVLKIEAGTIIRGEPRSSTQLNDPGSLVITRSARIDAQGTPSNPIIFTTAAVDNDPDGIADGVSLTVGDENTPDAYVIKVADQYSPGDTFLDADPKNSPLAPTANFAGATAGSSPLLLITDDGSGNLIAVAELDPENRSLWGGVIILGNAPTSIGLIEGDTVRDTVNGDIAANVLDDIFEGFIEGLGIADLGDRGVYGGMNPNDSSGAFRFVSIRHGGSVLGAANEINGLTMGGVGRGTLIENVEVYCNGDDGYEWFGGTVDTKNLISLWNNDDSFDIDEGFTGRGQFWFSLQGDDTLNGDHGGEHDGTDANHDSVDIAGFGPDTGSNDAGLGVPPAYITVYNATYIGGGESGNVTTDSGANRAFRIRDGFNGIYRNSIFTSFKDEPVRGTDSDNSGFFILENNIFYGVNAGDSYTEADGSLLDVGTNAQITSTGRWTFTNNTYDEDVFESRRDGVASAIPGVIPDVAPKFDRRGFYNTATDNDPFTSGNQNLGFDPRPDATVAASVTSSLAGSLPTFYTNTSYKGAFSPTATVNNIWTGSSASTTNPAWSVFGSSFLDLQ